MPDYDPRVVGVDPSPAMLAFARARDGAEHVEWITGDSAAAPAECFDLIIMTGNVAQHIPDAGWARTLRDLRARMRPGGTLAFETRNPAARAWESWSADRSTSRETSHGTLVEWMEVELARPKRSSTHGPVCAKARSSAQVSAWPRGWPPGSAWVSA